MKTKILYLENSDSPASVCDKMNRAPDSRILLVLPARSEAMKQRLDAQLIKRHAENLGSEIALITRDHHMKDHAQNLGIPVFQSLRVAQSSEWEKRTETTNDAISSEARRKIIEESTEQVRQMRENRKGGTTAFRKSGFVLGVLAFGAVLVTLLPRAVIHLTPKRSTQEIEVTVRASKDISAYNLSGDLPIHSSSIIVEGRDSLPTSGELDIPEGTATGEVLFTNLGGEAVTIPEGTRLVSNQGIEAEFATTVEVELPGGAGSTESAAITALNPGEGGNVEAGVINVVDGPLGLLISVSNAEATSGGSNRQGPGPSEADYERLRKRLIGSLWKSAIEELEASAADGDLIISGEAAIERVLEEQFTPETPQAANVLSLHMQIEFEVLRVRGEDIRGMLTGILNGATTLGFTPETGSLTIVHTTAPTFEDDGSISWNLKATRKIRATITPGEIREAVRGIAPQQAMEMLRAEYNLDTPPAIEMAPSWWPMMPLTPLRIQVFEE